MRWRKKCLSRGFARQTGRQTDANKQDKTDWMNIIDGRQGETNMREESPSLAAFQTVVRKLLGLIKMSER